MTATARKSIWIVFLFTISFLSKAQNCNNWLATPSNPSYVSLGDLDVSGNQITVEANINSTAINPGGRLYAGDIVSKHTGPNNTNYLLRPNSAEITTSNGYFVTPVICNVNLNQTYHVALVYDGATLKFYRDGYLMSQVNATGSLYQNNLDARIGLFDAVIPMSEQFLGYINEVRIWNVARTQSQIQTYMNTSLPNPTTQTGLLAYYTFNNLLNKQGNTAWNGSIFGAATINATNPNCTFTRDSCSVVTNSVVSSGFSTIDTVCVNTPVTITNTSIGASTYNWNFCVADLNQVPTATNLGNIGGVLSQPVFIDIVSANGNYYGFLMDYCPGQLIRLDFGNSLLNTPTTINLGNLSGILPSCTGPEGTQIVYNEGKWYGLVVGNATLNSNPSVYKIEFGANLTNPNPIATNLGNLGNMSQPIDLFVFSDNGNWYGLTVNSLNNTITRINFTNSFNNAATGTNLGNIGNLNYPTGVYAANDNGYWRVFVTNGANVNNGTGATITRLDFGNSLLNTPVGVNLGNPGNVLHEPRDFTIMSNCDQIVGFAVNGFTSDIVKFDFHANLSSIPTATSFGNIGNLNFPHSISKLFRIGADIYSFVTSVNGNTVTRLKFSGCTNSDNPSSTLQTPPPIIYSTPGTYHINLTVDDGLATQNSYCKQVVVVDCKVSTNNISGVINNYTPVIDLLSCNNKITVADGTAYNAGDTVLLIQMKGAIIDTTNTANFGNILDYKNAGNYEYNYVKQRVGNVIELKNALTYSYDIPTGAVQLIRVPYYTSATVSAPLTCLPWDGTIGGVLALNVRDTLYMNADIDVSGKGFRGGKGIHNSTTTLNCFQNQYFYPADSYQASEKGESITSLSPDKVYGRGKNASGGGGGNSHNSGGGGGSNANVGGHGGYQYELSDCSLGTVPFDNGGIGGTGMPYNNSLNKIFLGGGAGSGQANNPELFYPKGGNGGGILLLSTNTLSSNNKNILSKGDSATLCGLGGTGCHEGMGGGGGGGTMLMDINQILGGINCTVIGGNGGDMIVGGNGRLGPGGGGSGGLIWSKQSSLTNNIAVNLAGGANGKATSYANDPWGSTAGQSGLLLYNLKIPIDTAPFKGSIDSVRFTTSQISCSNLNFSGFAYPTNVNISSWQWSFGDGNFSSVQNPSHNYINANLYQVILTASTLSGCKDSFTIAIPIIPLTVDAGNDTIICHNNQTQLNGSTIGGSIYSWTPAQFLSDSTILNPIVNITKTTKFYLSVKSSSGCSTTDSITISIKPIPTFSIIPAASVCANASIQILASGGTNYQWSPTQGLSNPFISNPVSTPLQTTIYTAAIQDSACNDTATLSTTITVLPNPVFTAISSNDIDCTTGQSQLTATNNSLQYTWSPIAGLNNSTIYNPIAAPTITTTYLVVGKDQNGCTDSSSVLVDVSQNGKSGYYMPNAFTPNGDGLNDCFGIKNWGQLQSLQFAIYNRYGERVFYTENPTSCWDGTFKGQQQPSDNYVYYIKANTICGVANKSGSVLLIR